MAILEGPTSVAEIVLKYLFLPFEKIASTEKLRVPAGLYTTVKLRRD